MDFFVILMFSKALMHKQQKSEAYKRDIYKREEEIEHGASSDKCVFFQPVHSFNEL